MTAGPSPDPLRRDAHPADGTPLTGPESRLHRYLPEGDPEDRAQHYLRESDPRERAERYLSSAGPGAVEVAAREGDGEAAGALETMVAAVARQRRAAESRASQGAVLVEGAAAGSALEPTGEHLVDMLVSRMRGPLGSVAGTLEELLSGETGPISGEQERHLRAAAHQAGELLAILRDLQTLSRLRRREPCEMEQLGIGPLLTRAAARAQPALETRAVELEVREPDGALMVNGVPEQLDRALGAVLHNAVRFSPPGGRVTVSARLLDGAVQIEIADAGAGMEQAEADMLFQRVARGHAQETGAAGLGLGLTLVTEVMAAHRGRAWAESAAGRGTRVHLRIPAAAA
jgi:signal transduction histidine kinase